MGFLGGCCKFFVAVAVVPLAVIVSVFLETPEVTELRGVDLASRPAPAQEPAAAPASTQAFGKAESGGMGSGSMFDRIAVVYDITNKWMSLGLDQRWRRALVQDCMTLAASDQVLDLATGTADVSLLIGDRLRELGSSKPAAVTGLDPSGEMLRRGVAKAEAKGLSGTVRLVKGDAQDLSSVRDIDAAGTLSEPLAGMESDSIDKISMSFGVRNVPDRSLALREMKRVLTKQPASRVCILEFSLPDGERFLSQVAKTFITKVVPFIGKVATMNSGAEEYEYLERSILKFPKPMDFAAEMARNGLSVHSITSFAYGAVNLYAASPVA